MQVTTKRKKLSLGLLCLGVFMSLFFSNPALARMTSVPTLELSGLGQFSGQNLTVFYVSGRNPGVSTPGAELHTHKIFSSQGPFRISSSGEVKIPSTRVLANQRGVVFNHVLFVVHRQSKVALRNRDMTCPAPPQSSSGRNGTEYCRDSNSTYNTLWQSHRVSRSLRGNGTVRIRF